MSHSLLDTLLARHPLPTWRRQAWLVVALVTAAFVWATFARVDEVVVAAGEVVPEGKVKVIQHLEGGIVERIDVAEGDLVRAGDPLVRLDLATSGVNRNELQARLDREVLRRARLLAEISPTPVALHLPKDAAQRHPDMAQAEQKAYDARRREQVSTVAVLQEKLRQSQLAVQELDAKRRAVGTNLGLAQQRLSLSQSLLKEGLMAKMEHLKLQSEVESLQGELAALGPALPRARAAVAEAEQRLREADDRFRREANDDLGNAEEQIARLTELLATATDQGLRAEIKSPIDGVVKRLRYNTIGGVVAPGDPIMEIVPTEDKLVVTARLGAADRGYVHGGQDALVKVTTYDYVRYGGLAGRVVHVAPDSSTDATTNATYFEVVVETDKANLGDDARPLPISAGMQAVVDIHTGTRTVASYLLTPVLKLRHEAFRER
jgi:type I secretion membrane fusion protein, HlyD family